MTISDQARIKLDPFTQWGCAHLPICVAKTQYSCSLTRGEVDKILASTGAVAFDRAWENWCRRAGREPGKMTGV